MDYRKMAEDALRERAEIFEKRKALAESNATDAEKREGFERMDADMDKLAADAAEAVREGEREAEIRSLTARAGALGTPTPEKRGDVEDFNSELRSLLTGEARSVDFTASRAPWDSRAAIGVGGNSTGSAAEVTPDTFVATLLESLEESSDVLARVRNITTSGGEIMNWPRRLTKVGSTFQLVAENGTYPAVTDGSFDLFPLSAYKFGAIAEVTEEAKTDPALNIAAIVAEEMGADLAETLAAKVWNGTGTNQPHGLLTGAVQTSPFASVTAVTSDELIDLQHAVNQRYRRNGAFYLNDDTARDVRKLKDGNGNYVWAPALIAGQPDRLLGSPVFTDINVPAAGASAKSVVFGDVQRAYVLRTVRAISIVRSTEFGFNRDTEALKIRWRGDGGITDPAAYAVGVHASA